MRISCNIINDEVIKLYKLLVNDEYADLDTYKIFRKDNNNFTIVIVDDVLLVSNEENLYCRKNDDGSLELIELFEVEYSDDDDDDDNYSTTIEDDDDDDVKGILEIIEKNDYLEKRNNNLKLRNKKLKQRINYLEKSINHTNINS